jgi:hypothetical protein
MAGLCAQVEAVFGALDSAKEGAIRILAILDEWPGMQSQAKPTPDWGSFDYLPVPTGDPIADESALVEAGYVPPAKFSPNRNETVALFCGYQRPFQEIQYYPVRYRTKLALIDARLPHATLSGGSVLVAPDGASLLMHRRSGNSHVVHEAVGIRHSFCGSVRVGPDREGNVSDVSLRAAAQRETFEECGEPPIMHGGKIAIVKWVRLEPREAGGELLHEGIDCVYLGAKAASTASLRTPENARRVRDSERWEGTVESVSLLDDSFVHLLGTTYATWFPTGVAHHLLWLAVGAPNANPAFQRRAGDLLERVLGHLRELER